MEQSNQFKSLCNKVRRLNLVSLDIVEICNIGSLDGLCEVNLCYICYTESRLVKLQCGHGFCKHCTRRLEMEEYPRCAMCRSSIVRKDWRIKK